MCAPIMDRRVGGRAASWLVDAFSHVHCHGWRWWSAVAFLGCLVKGARAHTHTHPHVPFSTGTIHSLPHSPSSLTQHSLSRRRVCVWKPPILWFCTHCHISPKTALYLTPPILTRPPHGVNAVPPTTARNPTPPHIHSPQQSPPACTACPPRRPPQTHPPLKFAWSGPAVRAQHTHPRPS